MGRDKRKLFVVSHSFMDASLSLRAGLRQIGRRLWFSQPSVETLGYLLPPREAGLEHASQVGVRKEGREPFDFAQGRRAPAISH